MRVSDSPDMFVDAIAGKDTEDIGVLEILIMSCDFYYSVAEG